MAIAPLDLQTIFTQVDKVGKAQAAQKEGQAIQQSIHGSQVQRKTEEHIQQVNEAQDFGDGVDKINDRNARQNKDGKNRNKNVDDSEDNEVNEDTQPKIILREPSLGNKIDICY